jgi:type II secretory pathway component HofQ
MRLLLLVLSLLPAAARGEPPAPGYELCRRDVPRHGAPIDLDVKGADIHEVFRLIADIAHLNIVVPDDVTGSVTLRLRRAAWDAVVCAIAGAHHLTVTVHDNILLVMRR